MKSEGYHTPALLHQAINGLAIKSEGIYVDVTFGGGGHSRHILEQLHGGRLIAFDQDADAIKNAEELIKREEKKFTFVQHNFKYIRHFLRYHGIGQIDGLLADLGVSSHHFDVPDRGFSFRFDGRLDMRMNRQSQRTAQYIINNYERSELKRLLKYYGELPNAGRLSAAIDHYRQEREIERIGQLIDSVKPYLPKHKVNQFLAKLFQALRIEVNQEIDALKRLLKQSVQLIKPGGRLVVISYHSLEDRLVKQFIRTGDFEGGAIPQDIYGNRLVPFESKVRKVIVPDEHEINQNNRVRSAKLRIAERTNIIADKGL